MVEEHIDQLKSDHTDNELQELFDTLLYSQRTLRNFVDEVLQNEIKNPELLMALLNTIDWETLHRELIVYWKDD